MYIECPYYRYLGSACPNMSYHYYRLPQYTPIDLDGIANNERVVIYPSADNQNSTVEIQRFNPSTKKWVTEYSKAISNSIDTPVSILTGKWDVTGQNVIILWNSYGSGGFLDYTIIGRKNNKIQTLAERKEIFQGDVWFEGNRLFESEGSRIRLWVNRGGRPEQEPYAVPIIPGALIIRYSIADNGKVNIEKTHYQVHEGAIVQAIRTDLNPKVERILYSDQPYITLMKHRNAWKIAKKGALEFDIIPNGYDWDKAVHVTVKAV